MDLLSPYDFYRKFSSARSVSVVGNSDSALQWQNGAKIDASDVVVRFNRAQVRDQESSLGTRTDILVVNHINSIKRSPRPAEILKPRAALLLVNLDSDTGLETNDLADWLEGVPVFPTLVPEIIGHPTPRRKRPFTSGTYALSILTQMFAFQKMFITGFTLFGMVPGGAGHAFSKFKERFIWHEPNLELQVMASILSAFPGELDSTPEVTELLAAGGYTRQGPKGNKTVQVKGWKEQVAQRLIRGAYWLRNQEIRHQ